MDIHTRIPTSNAHNNVKSHMGRKQKVIGIESLLYSSTPLGALNDEVHYNIYISISTSVIVSLEVQTND